MGVSSIRHHKDDQSQRHKFRFKIISGARRCHPIEKPLVRIGGSEEGEITPSVGRSPSGTIAGISETCSLQSELPPLNLPSVIQNTTLKSGETQAENPQLIIEGDKITSLHVANQSPIGPKNHILLGPNPQVPFPNFAEPLNQQTGPLPLYTSTPIFQPASTPSSQNQPIKPKSQPTGHKPTSILNHPTQPAITQTPPQAASLAVTTTKPSDTGHRNVADAASLTAGILGPRPMSPPPYRGSELVDRNSFSRTFPEWASSDERLIGQPYCSRTNSGHLQWPDFLPGCYYREERWRLKYPAAGNNGVYL
ncbi:merzoite surface protein 1 [Striga asiatica]|uniref:Merzoite surface protein 1 n=1 Tax=Striga asiatica TaxID=4170 RepID=A0A5A7QXV6_STRAF|nr:merzoite surface protein 1 [Striga asiatica]